MSMINLPPRPQSLPETGLPFAFLLDLCLKVLFNGGPRPLWALADHLRLPVGLLEPLHAFLRRERLCEVARQGTVDGDLTLQLTGSGSERAEAALRRSRYAGPAPVTLADYGARIEAQAAASPEMNEATMAEAFAGVVLRAPVLRQLGAGLNSGRALLIHGPSGSGKTFIAERLAGVLGGDVLVPHALFVDDEVIQVFDPLVHAAVTAPGIRRPVGDTRWVCSRRPVVMVGGELTLAMLDLQFDPQTRFYVAPPQVKANNGLFIVDDLGRQLVATRDLLNRWIVPLDRRIDHYALHTGSTFRLPFAVCVVFSSNLAPADLADEAFLRRLGYKVPIGELSPGEYMQILDQACERAGIEATAASRDYLLRRHAREQRPLLACTPADLVGKLCDDARYRGEAPVMTESGLAWAWETYFGHR